MTESATDWRLEIPEPIEPGLYAAHVREVELRHSEVDDRPWLAWVFVLADGRTVEGGSSFSYSPKSKGGTWLLALLGKSRLAGPSTITAADLVERACSVQVETTDDGFSKVVAVLPPLAEATPGSR